MKKGLFLIITFLFVIILTLSGSSNFLSSLAIWDTCKDGTLNNKCSQEKPFFCSQGSLIKECNTCGCAAGFNCNTFTNECELSDYCEQSNGICQAECSPGSIELISLTESCNAGENINKLIQLEGSSLTLDLKLTNLKEAPIKDITAMAYIPFIAQDGLFLEIMEPYAVFQKDLILKLPQNLDKSKPYKLYFSLSYQDKSTIEEFNINFQGDKFEYTIKNVDFILDETKFEISQDLDYDLKIINRKCCIPVNINTNSESFLGYCEGKLDYNKCSPEKPLFCDNGLLTENCLKCGCPTGFTCNQKNKCESVIINLEVDKFFDKTRVDPIEATILKPVAFIFARGARSPIEAEVINIQKDHEKINIETRDVNLQISQQPDQPPKIDAQIQSY